MLIEQRPHDFYDAKMYCYIHLPFCRSKCIYCDFVVVVTQDPSLKQRYLDALLSEITHVLSQASFSSKEVIETIYFGGGTPGLFSAQDISQIIDGLKQYLSLSPAAEVTLEVNPDGAASPLEDYFNIGVNRLSIGVQSTEATELRRLSRIHSPEKAEAIVDEAQAAGFQNCSIDLMYGIPEQTQETWQSTLERVISWPIQHISMYGLQLEPETKLEALVKKGQFKVADDDLNADMYEQAVLFLAEHGFNRYEISNFAKTNCESRHNINYWLQGDYWAFGVGAHGFIDGQRYENTENFESYLSSPLLRQSEYRVTETEHLENKLIFGLRMTKGVSLKVLSVEERNIFRFTILPRLQRYIDSDLLYLSEGTLSMNPAIFACSNELLQAILA